MTVTQRRTFKESRKKDKKASFLIFQGVDESTFEKISDAKSSNEAWEILQKSYQGVDKAKKVQSLRAEFENLKMQSGEPVTDYVSRVQKVAKEMKRNGEEAKYWSVISIEELVGSLQAHEQRMMLNEGFSSLEQAMQTKLCLDGKQARRSFVPIRGNCRGFRGGFNTRGGFNIRGDHGGYDQTNKDFRPIQQYMDVVKEYGNLNYECRDAAKVAEKSNYTRNDKKADEPAMLFTYKGNEDISKDVCIGQLLEKGYDIHLKNNSLIIRNQKGELIAKVDMTRNCLFKLNIQSQAIRCMKSFIKDSSWLWHLIFGHLGFASLNLLSKAKMVSRLPQINHPDQLYESCMKGKQHIQSFEVGKSWRARRPLHLVHSDIGGPFDIP
ncbi:uncharacterized protein LOC133316539 [Gastrolobium bilobum]|uniref:uncharacterized protein LOC133316539 n=1 Tax=Gastrolobium bilobum TaxID=150636 RepID=UPI002AB0401C|nr:uncharacterized protein LOC133316539 [Gastrolobium bilobum]